MTTFPQLPNSANIRPVSLLSRHGVMHNAQPKLWEPQWLRRETTEAAWHQHLRKKSKQNSHLINRSQQKSSSKKKITTPATELHHFTTDAAGRPADRFADVEDQFSNLSQIGSHQKTAPRMDQIMERIVRHKETSVVARTTDEEPPWFAIAIIREDDNFDSIHNRNRLTVRTARGAPHRPVLAVRRSPGRRARSTPWIYQRLHHQVTDYVSEYIAYMFEAFNGCDPPPAREVAVLGASARSLHRTGNMSVAQWSRQPITAMRRHAPEAASGERPPSA